MKVVLSPASQRDLRDIVLYIALDNPRRARSFGRELRRRCLSIGEAPEAYPVSAHLGGGVRHLRHGVYLVFFVIEADHVRIRRVLHGARLINAEMIRPS